MTEEAPRRDFSFRPKNLSKCWIVIRCSLLLTKTVRYSLTNFLTFDVVCYMLQIEASRGYCSGDKL